MSEVRHYSVVLSSLILSYGGIEFYILIASLYKLLFLFLICSKANDSI